MIPTAVTSDTPEDSPMPSPHGVPKVPDEILVARLPAPALRVWLAIRSRQGDNASAWYPHVEYARMAAVKEKDVYALIRTLEAYGWLVAGSGKHLSCLVGRPYDEGKRGGLRSTTTPKEGGTTDYPQRRGTTTPKAGGTTTPKEGTHTNPIRIQSQSDQDEDEARASVGLWDGSLTEAPNASSFGPDAARHHAAIAERAAAPKADRLAWACRVLRAGQMPPADRLRDLGTRAVRHGPAALTVALVLTEHADVNAKSYAPRLRYLDSILNTLADHERLAATAPAERPDTPAARSGDRKPAGAAASFRDRRQADLDDPAAAHERNLAAAHAAIGARA